MTEGLVGGKAQEAQGQQSDSGAKEMWSLGSGGWEVRRSAAYRRNEKVSKHKRILGAKFFTVGRRDFNYVNEEN